MPLLRSLRSFSGCDENTAKSIGKAAHVRASRAVQTLATCKITVSPPPARANCTTTDTCPGCRPRAVEPVTTCPVTAYRDSPAIASVW